ncbi:MAG TPA: HAD family hydrolase [Gemmatimonadaceae bacterium]|nr:HAD family hydrolase [Gemmatimonadaceae bacterium]
MNRLPTAVFLDRDGTIIHDAHYLSRPDKVHLIAGAAEAIARINTAMIPVIVITNQSGIGRGYFTLEDYSAVASRLDSLLADFGAHIDATYFCPHAPEDKCECRKPGDLLFRRAQAEIPSVDLAQSLYIGDRMRDIEAGLSFGGDAVLVPHADTPTAETVEASEVARIAPSLGTALDWFLCTN